MVPVMRAQNGHWNSLNTTTVTFGALPPRAGESPRGTLYSCRAAGRAAGAGGGASTARLSQEMAAAETRIRMRALLFMLSSGARTRRAREGIGGRCRCLLGGGSGVQLFGAGNMLVCDVHRSLVPTEDRPHDQNQRDDASAYPGG